MEEIKRALPRSGCLYAVQILVKVTTFGLDLVARDQMDWTDRRDVYYRTLAAARIAAREAEQEGKTVRIVKIRLRQ